MPLKPKSISIAVIGPPNSGKSTWINRICGAKISSVSSKPQTTRRQILGITTIGDTQLVLIDTPGLVSNADVKKLNRQITTEAWSSLDEADMVLVFFDCVKTIDHTISDLICNLERYMTNRTKDMPKKPLTAVLFLNKYDKYLENKFRNETVYPVDSRFKRHFPALERIFKKVLFGSALNGHGLDKLQDILCSAASDRPWTYSEDTVTNQSHLDIAQEIVREKLFRHLNQELPYQIVQEEESWTEDPLRGLTRIDQKICVPKKSQIKMVIGKNGAVIEAIKLEASRDLQVLMGCKVALHLSVVYRKCKTLPDLDDMA